MSTKLDQAMEIAGMDPLPDDAEEQIEKLADQTEDQVERDDILSLLEAVFVQRNRPRSK
jgi:hypothetical protein